MGNFVEEGVVDFMWIYSLVLGFIFRNGLIGFFDLRRDKVVKKVFLWGKKLEGDWVFSVYFYYRENIRG